MPPRPGGGGSAHLGILSTGSWSCIHALLWPSGRGLGRAYGLLPTGDASWRLWPPWCWSPWRLASWPPCALAFLAVLAVLPPPAGGLLGRRLPRPAAQVIVDFLAAAASRLGHWPPVAPSGAAGAGRPLGGRRAGLLHEGTGRLRLSAPLHRDRGDPSGSLTTWAASRAGRTPARCQPASTARSGH